MFITEADRTILFYHAALYIAQKLNLRDVDLKGTNELLDDIRATDQDTYALLKSFLGAWNAWFEFHARIEKEGKTGNVSEPERNEIHARIRAKDEARQAIVQHLRSIA